MRTKKYPARQSGESFYVEYDEEHGAYGVFGDKSGHAYGMFSNKSDADEFASNMNRGGVSGAMRNPSESDEASDRAVRASAKAREVSRAAEHGNSIELYRDARRAQQSAMYAHEEAQRVTRGSLRADHKKAATLHRQAHDYYADLIRKTRRRPTALPNPRRMPQEAIDRNIEADLRKLEECHAVPEVYWGEMKDVLTWLRGNEMSMIANFFVDSLCERRFQQFYIDDRVSGTPVSSAFSRGRVTKRDVTKAIRSLMELKSLQRANR